MVDKSLMPHLFLSQKSAIAGKTIKRSRRIAYQMDGMKAQSDCSKKIWMHVGLKKMISITMVIRTVLVLMLSMVLSRFVVTPELFVMLMYAQILTSVL